MRDGRSSFFLASLLRVQPERAGHPRMGETRFSVDRKERKHGMLFLLDVLSLRCLGHF